MANYKGASRQHEIKPWRRRKDTRRFTQKASDFFKTPDGAFIGIISLPLLALLLLQVPFSGEVMLFIAWIFKRNYIDAERHAYDFPYRVPALANVLDGSSKGGKDYGKGITYLGNDTETHEQIYAGDSDLRMHMLVLGTTGSGKTEYLLGIGANALVQNTGFIFVDGKGDPKLVKEMFRLARYFGREDDLLIINFITSGRDFVDKQHDKVTNMMNMMGNTSSGMLIELIISLLDDSGSSGDMWKGRAISFVAALTRPLTYLRDKGFINLSPEKYIEYFELNVLEEMVWEHNGKYGEFFDTVVAPLRSYLITLPGYQKAKLKKQETKTLEQHGFIVMQLTRLFNDLTFNYGHIFKTKVGDIDFYDVVVNRRILVVLLPALERAPDSLRMLGKLIVGSIKQMMAGCLGNRVEGMVREIIDSRPTNAPVPYYAVFDEYGYYAVLGFAVAPAQARSLGYSIIFSAQDFSSLKKSSAEEAEATWENTNIRVIGRITSGKESETWRKVEGAAGESDEAKMSGYERRMGNVGEILTPQSTISIERRSQIEYGDLAGQQEGEFTFLIGKKESRGSISGVRVIRGMGFYTAGDVPKEMRINDLIPVESPEKSELPLNRELYKQLVIEIDSGDITNKITNAVKPEPILEAMKDMLGHQHDNGYSYQDVCSAAIGILLDSQIEQKANQEERRDDPNEAEDNIDDIDDVFYDLSESILNNPSLLVDNNENEGSDEPPVKKRASLLLDTDENNAFVQKALPIIKQHLFLLDDTLTEDSIDESLQVADLGILTDMELISNGVPYESLEDKWDAEERIIDVRNKIEDSTGYIKPPEPTSINIDTYKEKIDFLSKKCESLVKQRLKE